MLCDGLFRASNIKGTNLDDSTIWEADFLCSLACLQAYCWPLLNEAVQQDQMP